MIVPPASLVAPLNVAVSLIGFPIVVDAVALVTNEEQFVMFTRWGETKSFSSAENDVDERLFRYADPKVPHVPPDGNRVENDNEASPNVYASWLPRPPVAVAAIADVFTAPTALPLGPLMTVADPHDEPPHVRIEIVGTVPPLARS